MTLAAVPRADGSPTRASREPTPTWCASSTTPTGRRCACASFEDAFACVESGDADLAMIPIDNSIAGRVADIHHFLPTSDLHIVGERFLRIQFALMVAPGATTRLAAHGPQPRPRARPVPRRDPRARADPGRRGRHRRCRPRGRRGRRPDPGRDRAAAGCRDLRPRDPAPRRRGRGPQHHALHRALPRLRAGARDAGHVVTTFIFNVRNLPAALYKALGGFATNGVNMTKLESYMVERPLHRHPVPRRGRRPPRRPGRAQRARGARLLHHRGQGARRLPRRRVPSGVIETLSR